MFAMVDWDWLPNASVDDGLDGRLRLGCLPRSHSHGSVSISGVHCTGGHLHRKVAVAVAVANPSHPQGHRRRHRHRVSRGHGACGLLGGD